MPNSEVIDFVKCLVIELIPAFICVISIWICSSIIVSIDRDARHRRSAVIHIDDMKDKKEGKRIMKDNDYDTLICLLHELCDELVEEGSFSTLNLVLTLVGILRYRKELEK